MPAHEERWLGLPHMGRPYYRLVCKVCRRVTLVVLKLAASS